MCVPTTDPEIGTDKHRRFPISKIGGLHDPPRPHRRQYSTAPIPRQVGPHGTFTVVASRRRWWRHQGCLAPTCRAPPPPFRLLISGPRRCIGRCPRRTRPRALVSFDPVYSGSLSFSSLYDPVYLCYPLDTSEMQARTRSHQRRAVVRGTTTSTLGGPIQTVHAVAEHGDPLVLQPVSQVLREFSVLYVAKVGRRTWTWRATC
uniref:Uncharacterized protein n=1 Tax=Oryza rufipogon TaxID=4529 RepID=A0A0E0R9E1_ORYRU